MQSHILLVGIASQLAAFLEKTLSQKGYRVSKMRGPIPEPAQVQQVHPDLLIMMMLDVSRPNMVLCRRLSVAINTMPIMLLGYDNQNALVESLNICASDYLSVPFSLEEFLARIRARLRRLSWEHPKNLFVVGKLRLDVESRAVTYGDRSIELTSKEFELLNYLISHPRQVMTHQQILDRVWPDSVLVDKSNIVQVYVLSLRRKLGDAEDLIQTVWGVGYVLKAPSGASAKISLTSW